jgi:MoaA/NifB/PqqE/SkfB family radical SAM enzyme
MILRMTAACNNHCFFCIVDDEIARSRFRPTADLIAEVDTAAPEECIDIFGGEPTVDPSFWPVVAHVLASGRRLTIASNVRAFAKEKLAQRLAELGGERVIVRTTLMADEAGLHDRLNLARGAYDQTVRGIANLARSGIDVRANMVLLRENLGSITGTALVAFAAGVTSFKMSGAVRTAKFPGSVPDPGEVRTAIAAAATVLLALDLPFKFEKLPFCLAGSHAEHAWRVQAEDKRALEPFFTQIEPCRRCALAAACPGGERGTIALFGEAWANPAAQPSPGWTVDLDWRELATAQLPGQTRFVRVEREGLALEELAECGAAIAAFARGHGGISVI